MNRHRSRSRRPRWLPAAIVAAAVLLAGGGVAAGIALGNGSKPSASASNEATDASGDDSAQGATPGGAAGDDGAGTDGDATDDTSASARCDGTATTLRVAIASGFVDVVKAVEKDPCVDLEVISGDGFDGAIALKNGDADIWIPDSRERAYVVDPQIAATAPSLAESPVVMSVSPATALSLQSVAQSPSWGMLIPSAATTATASLALQSQDWKTSSSLLNVADALTKIAQAATGDKYLAYAATSGAVTRLQKTGAADMSTPVPDNTIRVGELRLVGDDVVVPTADGVPSLDYPWVQPSSVGDRAVAAAADALLARLQGEAGLKAAAKHGFVAPGTATATISGAAGDQSVPIVAHADIATTPLLFTMADPSVFSARVLALLDVSGSMADVPPGATLSGMDAVRQSMNLFASTMPDNVVVGGWAFGYQLNPPNDFLPLLAPAPLAQSRQPILQIASTVQAQPVGTALYNSYFDAYKDAQANYDPQNLNVVAVFTDGKNEDAPGRLDISGLLGQLQRIADPSKPIVTLFFGFGNADIPAMQQITAAVGGNVWKIDQPEQIVGAMIEATSQTGRIGIPVELYK